GSASRPRRAARSGSWPRRSSSPASPSFRRRRCGVDGLAVRPSAAPAVARTAILLDRDEPRHRPPHNRIAAAPMAHAPAHEPARPRAQGRCVRAVDRAVLLRRRRDGGPAASARGVL
ncbi:MAG: hypothetical protein AVDCRST_MAG67-3645, partial [uncultured Solirubrobacteraceae bacterium]